MPNLLHLFFTHRFYAGGSERSGQQIVGPPKKKSSNEVVEDLFKGAKEHGAVPVDRASKGPGESSKGRVGRPFICLLFEMFPRWTDKGVFLETAGFH